MTTKCCVPGCEKIIGPLDESYFKFPLNNIVMLKKWKKQLGLVNFLPTRNSKICFDHFLYSDIDSRLSKVFPVLKSTAVPKIFPRKRDTLPSRKMKHPASILRKQTTNELQSSPTTTNVNIISPVAVQVPIVPFVLTTEIIHPFPKVHQTYSRIPSDRSKLRRILPKSDVNISPEKKNIVTYGAPKPYLIMIPKLENVKPNTITPSPEVNNSKKHILRITVNKVRNKPDVNENREISDKEEIEIRNYKINRSVVFSLDLKTEKITVHKSNIHKTKHQKRNGNDAEFEKQSIKKKNSLTPESVNGLKELCTKTEEECNNLEKRLQNLDRKHEKERFRLQKLQKELAASEIFSTLTDQNIREKNKRKIEESGGQNEMSQEKKKFKGQIYDKQIVTNEDILCSLIKGSTENILKQKSMENNKLEGIQRISSTVLKAENWDINSGNLNLH